MKTDDIVQSIFRYDLLTKIPRTGFLMRGVDVPETVGEHIYSTAILAVLLLPELRKAGIELDGERLISMVLLHESGEILMGDIPAPAAAFFGPGGKSAAERAAGRQVLAAHPECAEFVDEFEDGESLEARIARTLDKLQMMIQVLIYESEGKGRLDEFWEWAGNFPRCGVDPVDALFDSLAGMRGKVRLDYQGLLP